MVVENSSNCTVAICQTYLVIETHLAIQIMSRSYLINELAKRKGEKHSGPVEHLRFKVATEIARTRKLYIATKLRLLDSQKSATKYQNVPTILLSPSLPPLKYTIALTWSYKLKHAIAGLVFSRQTIEI